MRLEEDQVECGRELLQEAIPDPFYTIDEGEASSQAILEWYGFLSDHLPLMALRTDWYLGLWTSDLPSTAPLATLLDSILDDEEWDGRNPPVDLGEDAWLVYNLAARRRELSRPDTSFRSSCRARRREREGETIWRIDDTQDLRRLEEPDPVVIEYDEGGRAGDWNIYENIGREIVWLTEELNRARDTDEREEIEQRRDDFLANLGARLPPHRRSEDPPDRVLGKLFDQTRSLLDILWAPLNLNPSSMDQEAARLQRPSADVSASYAIRRMASRRRSSPRVPVSTGRTSASSSAAKRPPPWMGSRPSAPPWTRRSPSSSSRLIRW